MEKVLPVAIPLSETYQLASFMMGIISQNEHVRENIYNSYIDIFVSHNDWDDMTLEFSDASCEDYRLKGIGEMDLFYLKNIAKETCAGFFKERIDQENYLLLFQIDEYELSYSEDYQKEHFLHDTYLYGYDDDYFDVMAYTNGHLRMMKVLQKEIINGLYSCLEIDEDTHFCSFRIHHKANVKICLKEILLQVNKYLSEERNVKGEPSGIFTYCCLQERLSEITENGDEDDNLNVKVFRMLWEHKKIMLVRNEYLGKQIDELNELTELARSIEQKGYMVMLMVIKYNLNHDYRLINRLKVCLEEMMDAEKKYWQLFYDIIKKKV